MLLTPFAADADDEKTQSFVTKYKEAYGDTPNQFAADAYDAIYIIKAAAEQAGVTPDMSVADIGSALEAAMAEISVDGLTGDSMTWQATGEQQGDVHGGLCGRNQRRCLFSNVIEQAGKANKEVGALAGATTRRRGTSSFFGFKLYTGM